jgi:ferredoxin
MPKVDKEKCIGCGICVTMCADCFKLDEEGKAESSCSGECSTVDEVISACPVDAISK